MTSEGKQEPSQEKIDEVAKDLNFVEGWCVRNNVAASALGRQVLDDQAAVSRWRAKGPTGCREEKRKMLAHFILTHPNGIEGYKRGKSGRQIGQPHARFIPNSSPASSRAGTMGKELKGDHEKLPTPSLSALEESDIAFVRRRAFTKGVPIFRVLTELVTLGLRVMREDDYEEEQKPTNNQEEGRN